MGLSTEVGGHVEAILTRVAAEMAALSDQEVVRDRPARNVHDRIVQALDAAVAAEDWSDVVVPGAA
jgi:hypothetical protein